MNRNEIVDCALANAIENGNVNSTNAKNVMYENAILFRG